jgi:hypothetical protein
MYSMTSAHAVGKYSADGTVQTQNLTAGPLIASLQTCKHVLCLNHAQHYTVYVTRGATAVRVTPLKLL